MNRERMDLLTKFMSGFSPDVQNLITGLRTLIQTTSPGVIEQVDIPSKIIAYGYGTRYADLVCAIAPFKNHVNVMFSQGVSLPDPAGILEGTGKTARHVKITNETQISNPATLTLLQNAFRLKNK